MYLEKLQDVVDSINLIREYQERSETRKYVNTNFVYKKNNYVFYYFALLNGFAPEFKVQYDRIFGIKALGKKRYWNQDDIRVKIAKYVDYCYRAPNRLEKALNDAIAYYTRGLVLSSAELARMQALYRMPGSRYKADLVDKFLKDLQKRKPEEKLISEKGIEGVKLSAEEKQQLREVPVPITGPPINKAEALAAKKAEERQPAPTAGFSDLGQKITTVTPPPPDLEVIHTPEPSTSRQANLPISQIQQRVGSQSQQLVSTTRRILTSGPAQDVGLATELGLHRAEERAGSFVTRSFGSVGRGISSFLSGGTSNAATGTTRLVGGVARGAASLGRGLGMLARLLPALGPVGTGILLIGLPLLLILTPILFQLFKSNSLCLPDGCPGGFGSGPGGANNPFLTVFKEGPPTKNVGEDIPYKITVTYTGSGTADIELTDKQPENEAVVDGSINEAGKLANGVITWNFSLKSGETKVTNWTGRSLSDKTWVINFAEAKITKVTNPGVGGSCPTPEQIQANSSGHATPETCVYFNPAIDIFDTNIASSTIDVYVTKYSPLFINGGLGDEAEFRRRVGIIISRSQQVGLNPAIFLGYWRTETTFGTVHGYQFGCLAAPSDFESQIKCAVGLAQDGVTPGGSLSGRCASPKNPQRDAACQQIKGIRDSHPEIYKNYPISYPISTFDDFVEVYGSKAPNLNGPGSTNNNCIHTYNLLVSMAEELGVCHVSSGPNPDGKVIVLDPGHTNEDLFHEHKNDENALNLLVANRARALLEKNGYQVILTHPNGVANPNQPNSYYEDLQGRINVANDNHAAVFVAIHHDNTSASSRLAGKTKGYYRRPSDAESRRLADSISRNIANHLGGYGIDNSEPGDYYVLNPTSAETGCSGGKDPHGGNCTITQVVRGLQIPGVLQEIFVQPAATDEQHRTPYSTLNSEVDNIALGYCSGIAQYLDNKTCQP